MKGTETMTNERTKIQSTSVAVRSVVISRACPVAMVKPAVILIAVFLILVTLFLWGRRGGEVTSHEVSAATWPPPSVG
jgi:hypothetical protein